MKVHITLVGGQPAPVYNGIIAIQPDKVVFIHSKESHSVVDAVTKEINIVNYEKQPLNVTDPTSILVLAEKIAKQFQDDEVTLNISSGPKSWTYLFGIVFNKMPNASVVYMDQNNVLWNYRTMEAKSDFEFNMDALFRLYGNPLIHYVPFSEYTESDKSSMDSLASARIFNFANFNELTTILSKEKEILIRQNNGKLSLSNGDCVEWERPDFARIELTSKRHGVEEFIIESPHAVNMTFHAGWFEYKVARMISHWRYAKDIRLNCIFPPQGSKSIQHPKNEIDIIVNTGSKILFVECKTKITTSTDIDKFRTAVKNYGGLGSKALFVTDSPMTELNLEKCRESDIIAFSLSDPKIGSNKEQILFKTLENELFNINTK